MYSYNKLVCNLNFFLFFRLVCGYYYDAFISKWSGNIFKIFCFASCVVRCYNCIKCSNGGLELLKICDYLPYFLVSFCTKDKYFLQQFRYDAALDSGLYASKLYKQLEFFLTSYIVFLNVTFVVTSSSSDVHFDPYCSTIDWYLSLNVVYAINVGRSTTVALYALIYCRVKVFHNRLQRGLVSPELLDDNKCLESYLKLTSSDQAAPKILVVTNLMVGFITIILLEFNIVYNRKVLERSPLAIAAVLVGLIYNFSLMFFPAVIMESVSGIHEDMQVNVASKMSSCSNERMKAKLRRILWHISERPVKQNLLTDSIILNASIPVAFVTLTLQNLVWVYQIPDTK